MTRLEYDLLREQEPWMKLPIFDWLTLHDTRRLETLDRAVLVAEFTGRKMRGEISPTAYFTTLEFFP